MLVLFMVLLVIISILLILLCFKLFKWTLKSKRRVQVFLAMLVIGLLVGVINHFFFKNMWFIQSEVYPNLYLVKYPDKNYSVVERTILEKIRQHLQTENEPGKTVSYNRRNSVLFYEYGGSTFGFIGKAGTGYFLDHEEDHGGFVSEELGMYTDYRLAEFYYEPCKTDSNLLCGEISYFKEGEFFKADTLTHLVAFKQYIKRRKTQGITIGQKHQEESLPIHGALDKDALSKYYPRVLDEESVGAVYAEKINLPTKNATIVSLLRNTVGFQQIFLCTHNKDLGLIDVFYVGKATDFDNGKEETITYNILKDSTMVFDKVVWGMLLKSEDNEKKMDTLAHEIIALRVNQKGGLNYAISKNPKHYALEVFVMDADPNGTNLRDAPNGEVVQTLDYQDEYVLKLAKGENGWFRVVEIESVNEGKLKMPIGFAWVHRSVIGMRTNRNVALLDAPKSGKQIGTVTQDIDVTILDFKADWIKIEYQESSGWIAAKMRCGNPVTTCP